MTPTLTVAQLQTLKAHIAANTNTPGGLSIYAAVPINQIPLSGDGNAAIAEWYSGLVAPAFIVWKTSVPITQVGDHFVATELAGLTTANASRLQTMALYSTMGVNPSLADRRAFFDDIFSVGGQTIAKLAVLWRRSARRIEQLYATGEGSDAAPAGLATEGALSSMDVNNARNLP